MKTFFRFSFILILIFSVACGSDDDTSCTTQTWYQDADGDAYGNANITLVGCSQPTGYVNNDDDIDDSNSTVYPSAQEICDGLDNDGDGQIDGLTSSNCGTGEVCENGNCVPAVTYYLDVDADGFGDANNFVVLGSITPVGYVTDNTDCDDSNPSINPGAQEDPTDGIDNDCDGDTDECDINSTTECDCTDGMDNDNDGFVDCADSDCIGMAGC